MHQTVTSEKALEALEQTGQGSVTYLVRHATMTPIETPHGTDYVIHIKHSDVIEATLISEETENER